MEHLYLEAWGRSSVGRALQSHCRGRRFDSDRLHQSHLCAAARSLRAMVPASFFVPCRFSRGRTGLSRAVGWTVAGLCDRRHRSAGKVIFGKACATEAPGGALMPFFGGPSRCVRQPRMLHCDRVRCPNAPRPVLGRTAAHYCGAPMGCGVASCRARVKPLFEFGSRHLLVRGLATCEVGKREPGNRQARNCQARNNVCYACDVWLAISARLPSLRRSAIPCRHWR